jgi:c-di-GMP-binding flagellar brake protein YcgR
VILVLIITALAVLATVRLLIVFQDKIKFFTLGSDSGFKFSETALLWKLAKMGDIEEPQALFLSVPTLNRAISNVITDARRRGIENSDRIQNFLTKLYKFRTKLNLEHENKKGLESTKYLDKGQKLRIIFPGHGVFASTIMNNGYEMIITLPTQNRTIPVMSEDWVNHEISVYLWRKGDASYVFDTRVTNAGVFNGQTVLYLAQTNQLLRAQKRKSVRCECNLNAAMYFIKKEVIDFNLVETDPGYKVVLEDISEDGAMIRVGGQGVVNAQIKLQFTLNDVLILMYGIVRAVEYNKEINQSRLHFECVHLDKDMKNAILSFVYNVLPQDQKDVFDALSATEEDKAEDETAPEEENPAILLTGNAAGDVEKNEQSGEEAVSADILTPPQDNISARDIAKLAELDVNDAE